MAKKRNQTIQLFKILLIFSVVFFVGVMAWKYLIPDRSGYQRTEPSLSKYKSLKSRDIAKRVYQNLEKERKIGGSLSQAEFVSSVEDFMKTRTEVCRRVLDFFERNPNIIDPSFFQEKSDEEILRLMDDLNEGLFEANAKLIKSFEITYNSMVNSNLEFDVDRIIEVENAYSGCGDEGNVGIFILTMSEVQKTKPLKAQDFAPRVMLLATSYSFFKSFPSLLKALGIVGNLNSQDLLTEYEVFDLNELREEAINLSFEYREELRLATAAPERKKVVENYNYEKELLRTKVQDFLENLEFRYDK